VNNHTDDNLLPGFRVEPGACDAVPDEVLLAALREAVEAAQAVPPDFMAAARDAYTWHSIEAELARLAYDCSLEAEPAMGLRSESASIRALSFVSARLSIEVEITSGSLLGQLIPARPGTVEVHQPDGGMVTVPVDEAGCFAVEPKPGGPFRLRCHTGPETDVLTGWVTL
jgi:hypothetical protein